LPVHEALSIIAPVCTLAIYFQADEQYPVVVAANRDEFYERPTIAPASLSRAPWVIGGKDLRAGGTWLGVNGYHLVAGLLNRRTAMAPEDNKRSRGLLCLEALRQATPEAVLTLLEDYDAHAFNSFNLLVASPSSAFVFSNAAGSIELTRLEPGLHLLTNLALNDVTCPRIAKSHGMFEAALPILAREGIDAFRTSLRTVLSDHSTPLDPRSQEMPNNLCVHGERYGTRSSSLLAYSRQSDRFRMWYAEGPPCEAPYREIALPSPES
jgi:uncharacterized protein with NRDE domain